MKNKILIAIIILAVVIAVALPFIVLRNHNAVNAFQAHFKVEAITPKVTTKNLMSIKEFKNTKDFDFGCTERDRGQNMFADTFIPKKYFHGPFAFIGIF